MLCSAFDLVVGDDDEAVSAGSAKPYSTSSGNFSGEEKDFPVRSSAGDDPVAAAGLLLPGKFKQGILHRYLSDSYRMSFVRSSDIGGGGGEGEGDVDRVRKMSGSPTSRDSAVSTSCRSTPVGDHRENEGMTHPMATDARNYFIPIKPSSCSGCDGGRAICAKPLRYFWGGVELARSKRIL